MRIHFYLCRGVRYCCIYRDGKRISLGRWDEGKPMPDEVRERLRAFDTTTTAVADPGVTEAVRLYLAHVYENVRNPDGTLRSRYERATRLLRPFCAIFGDTPISHLIPGDLMKVVKAVQAENPTWPQHLPPDMRLLKAARRWSDTSTKQAVQCFIQMLSYLESYGMIEPGTHAHFKTFKLEKPIVKVRKYTLISREDIEKIAPFTSPVVADLMRIQWLTAMRPSEAARMRKCDVEIQEIDGKQITVYMPHKHKNKSRGHSRGVVLAGEALEIWRRVSDGVQDHGFPFSPMRSVAYWRTKFSQLFRKRNKTVEDKVLIREASRKRKISPYYSAHAYNQAIKRAISAARKMGVDVPVFGPYDIRHSRLSQIQKEYGWEAAQAFAGHATISATQWYAHQKMMREVRLQAAYETEPTTRNEQEAQPRSSVHS